MQYKTIQLKIPVIDWRRLRVSLRSLFMLVAIASLALGWWRDHYNLSQEIHDLKNPRRGWDTSQVLGPPDTPAAGDYRTAWASETEDGQQEWLVLEYADTVRPTEVVVHATYNPGAVIKVTVFDKFGLETIAWEGVDPTPTTSAMGVSQIPLNTQVKTRRIKVYLDSPGVPGWNEIDAVGLRDGTSRTQWAATAYASSSYGRNNELMTFGGVTFFR